MKGGKTIAKKVSEITVHAEDQKPLKIVKHLPKDEERLGELSQRGNETSIDRKEAAKLEKQRQ